MWAPPFSASPCAASVRHDRCTIWGAAVNMKGMTPVLDSHWAGGLMELQGPIDSKDVAGAMLTTGGVLGQAGHPPCP